MWWSASSLGCSIVRRGGFTVSRLCFWVLASCSNECCTNRDEPTQYLDGRQLPFKFVGRNLIRPEPPRPRTPPYASTEPFVDPFGATTDDRCETGGEVPPELGMLCIGNGAQL
jgi:hypothetical protein